MAETAISPSLSEKKELLLQMCGLNLQLQNRQVHFTPQKQWAALAAAIKKSSENPECFSLVPLYEAAKTYFEQNP